MSVYEEIKADYLIRIKDLNLLYKSHASRKGDKVISSKQRSLATYA
jgi:hypothetical protein